MKKVSRTGRHLRWNWQQSPDDPEKVRYHFVVVDDKGRDAKLNEILEQLRRYNSVEEIRKVAGKVSGTKLMYLLGTYDSPTAPTELSLERVAGQRRRDTSLTERVREGHSIVAYVARIYEQ